MQPQPRMDSPAMLVPGAYKALGALAAGCKHMGLPVEIIHMVHLRASQINGCSFCVDMHSVEMERDGTDARKIYGVGAWRESPHFTDQERVALELAEALTRIADQPDPIPDELWAEASKHFNQEQLAALVLAIANINVWNRLNVAVRSIAGSFDF